MDTEGRAGMDRASAAAANPEEVMVPMRDGIRLHTRIWLPDGDGRHPVVFTRAYWPGFGNDWQRFTAAESGADFTKIFPFVRDKR